MPQRDGIDIASGEVAEVYQNTRDDLIEATPQADTFGSYARAVIDTMTSTTFGRNSELSMDASQPMTRGQAFNRAAQELAQERRAERQARRDERGPWSERIRNAHNSVDKGLAGAATTVSTTLTNLREHPVRTVGGGILKGVGGAAVGLSRFVSDRVFNVAERVARTSERARELRENSDIAIAIAPNPIEADRAVMPLHDEYGDIEFDHGRKDAETEGETRSYEDDKELIDIIEKGFAEGASPEELARSIHKLERDQEQESHSIADDVPSRSMENGVVILTKEEYDELMANQEDTVTISKEEYERLTEAAEKTEPEAEVEREEVSEPEVEVNESDAQFDGMINALQQSSNTMLQVLGMVLEVAKEKGVTLEDLQGVSLDSLKTTTAPDVTEEERTEDSEKSVVDVDAKGPAYIPSAEGDGVTGKHDEPGFDANAFRDSLSANSAPTSAQATGVGDTAGASYDEPTKDDGGLGI